jgi:hypothetical protein
MTTRALLLSLLFAAACDVGQGQVPVEVTADPDDWAMHVQPYVALRCGTLDCHGDPGRPFRIYSEEGLRMSADRELPLTDLEIDETMTAGLGVSPLGDIESHPLLLEPLHPDAGGWHHQGDPVWLSRDDPGYACLHDWLSGADPSTSCAAAFDVVPRGTTP